MLSEAGFDVIEAADGTVAVHELRKHHGEIAVLVTDIDMGRMNGLELAQSVKDQFPEIPIVFISALPVLKRPLAPPRAEATGLDRKDQTNLRFYISMDRLQAGAPIHRPSPPIITGRQAAPCITPDKGHRDSNPGLIRAEPTVALGGCSRS